MPCTLGPVMHSRYHAWYRFHTGLAGFQIEFIVSLILDVVAHEPDLMLDEDVVSKAKTDCVDILFFPTGGGKTEAFLGILAYKKSSVIFYFQNQPLDFFSSV